MFRLPTQGWDDEAMGVAGRDGGRGFGPAAGEGSGANRMRVRRQRDAYAALPEGVAKDNFRDAILARAEELLHINPEAADALLEFLPKDDRERVLAGFFER